MVPSDKVEGKRTHWKKRYNFTCPVCGKELWAKPSMFMTEFGLNSGSGNCLKCNVFLHLKITPDIYGEKMKAEKYDEYVAKSRVVSKSLPGYTKMILKED